MGYKIIILIFVVVGGLLLYAMKNICSSRSAAIVMWLASYLLNVEKYSQ